MQVIIDRVSGNEDLSPFYYSHLELHVLGGHGVTGPGSKHSPDHIADGCLPQSLASWCIFLIHASDSLM